MDILGTVPRLLGEETSQPNAQLMPGGPPIELNPLVEKKFPLQCLDLATTKT